MTIMGFQPQPRAEHAQHETNEPAAPEKAPQPQAGPGMRQMLALGRPTPQQVNQLLLQYPAEQSAMVVHAHQHFGNAFVSQIFAERTRQPEQAGEVVDAPPAPPPGAEAVAPATMQVEVDEAGAARELIAGGMSDENQLTNEVYWRRYPAQRGIKLKSGSPEAQEWLRVRNQQVRPALVESRPSPETAVAHKPPQPPAPALPEAAPTPATKPPPRSAAPPEVEPAPTAPPKHEAPQAPPAPAVVTAPAGPAPTTTGGGPAQSGPVVDTQPTPEPTPEPKQAAQPTTEHVDVKSIDTTPEEAGVLNGIRASVKRLDPKWVLGLQAKLQVKNATGVFNTETLRAVRGAAGEPKLSAAAILKESFLQGLHEGEPYMEGDVLGKLNQAPKAGATTPADRTAQDMGYASHAAWKATWVDITLLGKTLGPGHPHLAARVRAADAFLKERHPGMDVATIRKTIGWDGSGNGAYDTDAAKGEAHQHTMGLAIDVEKAQNPYIFRGKTKHDGDEADDWYEKFFKHACKVYGGEPITAANMMAWSKEMSTEELFEKIHATSEATRQYLELAHKDDETIEATLLKAGYKPSEVKAEVGKVKARNKVFHNPKRKQTEAKAITNISEELLLALRDAAGLAWGGVEMSGNENGDFMHFDCRNDPFGKAVYDHARKNKKAAKAD